MNANTEGKKIYDLAAKLFPIYRSITGDGVRETLRIIKLYIQCDDFQFYEIPSGTVAFDWIVPDEWKIREAYIENENHERIIDFKNNNLHVVGYSIPVDKWVNLDELRKYVFTQEEQPDIIPYVTSYYSKRCGFCMSANQLNMLPKGNYHMYIDSELFSGSLTYGELFIRGQSDKEIFFTTYICHPSMANNECSGPALLSEIIKYVKSLKDRRYSYRFVFAPETIGAITYLATHNHLVTLKNNVIAGFNLTCVGDNRNYTMIESRRGNTLADKVLLTVLNTDEKVSGNYKKYDYLGRGSDERQYCSPGVDLPFVTFCRTRFYDYPEYHTSADDMSLVTPDGFQGSYDVLKCAIDLIENNRTYKNVFPCEPQLGRHGLYPTVSQKGRKGSAGDIQNVLAFLDGNNDVISICDRLKRPVGTVLEIIYKLKINNLIEEVQVDGVI
ncbi:aminopeptidase-like domain-containing protein [Oribacterium sp. KHPX15]|uniref:DUF4910 domain-containing protein n=1 Tax=Oribacterium sp. KHPX15 TaxID=1855342 RepID=UPI00089AA6EA|nr:DUF4910 domain-containing protein [Oribacterium sp. KHPX15]SEA83338.1 aminopeptidase-like domain-containing protein [Oribacterium sp. KHPX15]